VLLNNGTRCKGTTDSFDPKNRTLLVKEIDVEGRLIAVHDLDMQSVHVVFFVHDLALMRTSRLTSESAPSVPPKLPQHGKMLRVMLLSGEVIDGMSYDYEPRAKDFFLFPNGPLNRAYNIEKAYISREAAARVAVLSDTGSPLDRPRAESEKEGRPAASTTRLNVNDATLKQLTQQLGLSSRLAAEVLETRKHLPFQSWDDVAKVKGIGPKTLRKLQEVASLGARSGASGVMGNRMVVRRTDGKLLKGLSSDFFPKKPFFQLHMVDDSGVRQETLKLAVAEIDAIFFVHDFAFERSERYTSLTTPYATPLPSTAGGGKLRVIGIWGGVLEGISHDYEEKSPGFFLVLTDERRYNLERVFINRQAVERVFINGQAP